MSDASSPPLYKASPYREPFNVDSIFRLLDKVPFSPPFLVLIPALVGLYSEKVLGVSLVPKDPYSLQGWKSVITPSVLKQYALPLLAVAFIAVKTVNRTLSRISLNNGYYRGDKPDWNKEVCVVTGGANGIGKEIAVLLAERSKKKVVVLDYGPMAYSNPNVVYYKVNVADESAMAKVAEQIRKDVGEPTIVINNAGIAIGRTIIDTPDDGLHRVMSVNAFASVYSAKLFVPHMIKINHGHVVTVASSASYMAIAHLSSYAMSKAAALAFHEVLKHETRARYNAPNIRTTICCPTKVDTQLGQNMADHPSWFFTPLLTPQTVARRIVRAIDRGRSEHIMLPGYTEILPAMRGVPAWFKRLVEISGDVDNSVTDESEKVAARSGYQDLQETLSGARKA